eukprot:1331699-Prorocentrum_lima.AAC.1
MTSSLVGSEMCIRDSLYGELKDNHGGHMLSHKQEELQILVGHDSKGAVSYTHLTLPTICSV